MMSESLLGKPSTSPFAPHFGKSPHSLVGRDNLLSEIGDGLVTGPSDQRYTSILMGVRGSGKTVVLNEVEDRAAADGWVVLSMDAGTPGLLERIVQAISSADRTYEALGLGLNKSTSRRAVEKSIGIRLGPLEGKMASTDYHDHKLNMGLREHLTYLVQAAQRTNTSVLLTVDELQGIDRMEGRRLSNDLQHITKRAEMPLAFLGAGLLELKHTLMQDRKMTFFHRCEHFDMPPLETDDATVGLAGPIRGVGGTITNEALALAARSVDGSPYKLQVIGDIAWKTAGAPGNVIDAYAVEVATNAAEETLNAKVGVPAWHDLSEGDQDILASVTIRGGTATPSEVAQNARASEKSASNALRRLTDLGYVDRPRHGIYRATNLVPRDVVLSEGWHSVDIGGSPTTSSALLQTCRKWMPRAKTYCVLTQGHSGGCRSK